MAVPEVLPYFQLAGQIALVVGAFFAAYQLLQVQRNRRDQGNLQIVTSFNTEEFRDAFANVCALPLSATGDDVRSGGAEMERAAATIMMVFEMLRVLVFNRMIQLGTLDQAMGGFLRESWRRLETYVEW